MKRHAFFTLLSVCLLGFSGHAEAQSKADCFKMQSTKGVKEISVEKFFSDSKGDNELKPFDGIEAVYALSVSMDITRLSENFLVRVLLKDAEGRKHLVAESYKEIAPSEKTMLLTDYCEETALLAGVKPVSLLVITNNAEITLHHLSVATEGTNKDKSNLDIFIKRVACLREQQVKEKVEKVNEYIADKNKLWKAGITGVSLQPYEEKMRALGCPLEGNTYGMEFYSGGIIDIGLITLNQRSSQYVDTFDWRERHGKNWITPVKDQGNSGYCSAFSAVSCTEALVNLYLNNIVNLDLSEQEAACCNNSVIGDTTNFYNNGIPMTSPLEYIRDVGVCEEDSYPFVDDSLARFCHSDQIVPQIIVTIDSISSDLKYPTSTNEDRIKSALINCGPLSSGIYSRDDAGWRISHAMALVGYGVIKEGDIVQRIWNYDGSYTGLTDTIHVSNGHPLIGRNYWIFKNSYLQGGTTNPPYMLVAMDLNTSIQSTYALYHPTWKQRTSTGSYVEINNAICEDADGDGYFFWGLGPKPTSAPSGIPDVSDGDDSNPLLGPMDEYGYCEDLDPANRPIEFISATQSTFGTVSQYSHIEVINNATWTIKHSRTFYNGAKITIRNGCSLILTNGAVLEDVEIVLESGATLKILENGKVHLRNGIGFDHPIGAVVEIDYGEII